jgi:hypothetical protein
MPRKKQAEKKRRRGPPQRGARRSSVVVGIRVMASEMEIIRRSAEREGVSVSEWVRRRLGLDPGKKTNSGKNMFDRSGRPE